MNKRGYEFSFVWIFAVIVGAFVIFLAVFTVYRIIDQERTRIDTVRGKEIGTLLTPAETNLEDSRLVSLIVPRAQPTRLFNDCVPPDSSAGNPFGTQKISALVKSSIGGDWQQFPGVQSSFHNKYLFAKNDSEAEEEFFVLSKPFIFPFKVADVIVLWSDTQKYCFIDTNAELKDELARLRVQEKNVALEDSIDNCVFDSIKVCFDFDASECGVVVRVGQNEVNHKNLGSVFFPESTDVNNKYALLLAAIFSDPDKYECQMMRIGARATSLAETYIAKSNYLTSTSNCNSAPLLPASLNNYITTAENIGSSVDLVQLKDEAEELKARNAPLNCRLF